MILQRIKIKDSLIIFREKLLIIDYILLLIVLTSTDVQYLNTSEEQTVNSSFNGPASDKQARQILLISKLLAIIFRRHKINIECKFSNNNNIIINQQTPKMYVIRRL